MQQYKNHNGIRHSRIVQNFVARVLLILAISLLALVACAPFTSEPVSAQDSNATLPPTQRCAILGRLAYAATQARDMGKPAQDVHIMFDDIDPLAAMVINHVYFSPTYGNVDPGLAGQATNEACYDLKR